MTPLAVSEVRFKFRHSASRGHVYPGDTAPEVFIM
jgi:hypothetical protein